MGLLDKLLGDKKEENQNLQKTDTDWRETKYGYAPKDAIKVHFSPEREIFPKGSGRKNEAYGIAASHISDTLLKLESLDSKTYHNIEFLKGKCSNCNNNFIIPQSKKPIFFKCPFCSTSDEKILIKLLLYLNPDNEIFSNCPKCNKYSYLKVNENTRYFNFNCKACNNDFILNKDHPIELTNYSDNSVLNWCSACGHLFETSKENTYPIKCPRCESKLDLKKK